MGDTHKNSLQRSGNWRELLSRLVEQILLREDLTDVGKETIESVAMSTLMLERHNPIINESLDERIFSETDEGVAKLRDAIEGDERLLFKCIKKRSGSCLGREEN